LLSVPISFAANISAEIMYFLELMECRIAQIAVKPGLTLKRQINSIQITNVIWLKFAGICLLLGLVPGRITGITGMPNTIDGKQARLIPEILKDQASPMD
jgi:hypothetical protein